jgi:hypothetical protein
MAFFFPVAGLQTCRKSGIGELRERRLAAGRLR